MPVSAARPGDPGRLGPYRCVGRLGAGGAGTVHLAVGPDGRAVAVKVLHPEHLGTEGRRRFAREVEVLRRLRGPHLAQVLDADVDGPVPWIATSFVAGERLDEHVAAAGPMSRPALRRLAGDLAEALRTVHDARVVHRDVTPGNVLLVDGSAVLIDFGVAHLATGTPLTTTGDLLGTVGYLAPEQARGDEARPESDVWALGACLAFAGTGRPPFGTGRPEAVLYRVATAEPDLAGLDPELLPLVRAALSREPASRPRAEQVAAAIAGDGPAGDGPAGDGSAVPHLQTAAPGGADTVVRRPDDTVARRPGEEGDPDAERTSVLPAVGRERTAVLPRSRTSVLAPPGGSPAPSDPPQTRIGGPSPSTLVSPVVRPAAPPPGPAAGGPPPGSVWPAGPPPGVPRAGGPPPDPWAPPQGKPRPARSGLVVPLGPAGLAVLGGALLVVYLLATTAPGAVALLVALGMFAWHTWTRGRLALQRRRMLRGARATDVAMAVAGTPSHLLVGFRDLLGGVLRALPVAAPAAAGVALGGRYLLGLPPETADPAAGALAVVLVLVLGMGGRRRAAARAYGVDLVNRGVGTGGRALAVVASVALLALLTLQVAQASTTTWWPAG